MLCTWLAFGPIVTPAELLTVSDPVTVLFVVELTKLSAPTLVPSAFINAFAGSAVPSKRKLS